MRKKVKNNADFSIGKKEGGGYHENFNFNFDKDESTMGSLNSLCRQ